MIIKNSPSPKNSNQAQEIGHIKYSYKESFKRENKSILDDSEFIENYNKRMKFIMTQLRPRIFYL